MLKKALFGSNILGENFDKVGEKYQAFITGMEPALGCHSNWQSVLPILAKNLNKIIISYQDISKPEEVLLGFLLEFQGERCSKL